MGLYLQYHNGERLGWLPLAVRPFQERELGIYTRRAHITRAIGGQVLVIVSVGRPRRYYLWESFRIEQVEARNGEYTAWGTGWQLMPPQRLRGPAFDQFRRECANFVSFRAIDRMDYAATLLALAERFRRRTIRDDVEDFCTEWIETCPTSGDAHYARGCVRRHLGKLPEAQADFAAALRLGTEFTAAIHAMNGGENSALLA